MSDGRDDALMRALAALGISIAAVLVLAGCTPASSHSSGGQKPSTAADATAVVTRADITPVLSLAAEVQSNVSFQITAPATGVLQVDAAGLRVVSDDGKVHQIPVPPRAEIEQQLVQSGSSVPAGLPVAIGSYRSFALVAPVEGADLLRFGELPVGARAQVDGSGAPFVCELLDPRPTTLAGEDAHTVVCAIPDSQPVITGMTGIVAVAFPGVTGVLALPVAAVAGSVKSGLVSVIGTDGEVTDVPVKLGVSDGHLVEVTSGLDEGDTVLLPSPALL